MHRRSNLRWIVLTALSLTIVFTISTIARAQNQEPTEGSLQAFDKDGKPAGECPLKHTDVKAQVSGFISRVTVTQEFENNFPNKIEAVYKFALPDAAAVDEMTMVIGERVIKGKILRREEARAIYSAARQEGRIASLLNQEH
jgi:Ca-activated chloride channel family protein